MRVRLALLVIVLACGASDAHGQGSRTAVEPEAEFGPVVRAYLGYLRSEQEVVDDRASRHEINPVYYRRNSNRIRALRQMTIQLARATHNDYVPELYAVAGDEFATLFDPLPAHRKFAAGEIINDTFRYLGTVRAGEVFYLFARLDIYEQADLLKKKSEAAPSASAAPAADNSTRGDAVTRPRRANTP